MKKATVTIVDKWIRPGDINPKIKVYGIKTKSGHIFETCGNFGRFQTYPDPCKDVENITLNKTYEIAYGNAVSYEHRTLIGITQ